MQVLKLSDEAAGRLAQAVKANKDAIVCETCIFGYEPGSCVSCTVRRRPALEVLIESHVPLVRSLAARYKVNPEKFDELISVGLSTLVSCLNTLETLDDVTRIGAYVRRCVGWALHRAVSYDGPIYVPVDAPPEARELNTRRVQVEADLVKDNRPSDLNELELEEALTQIISSDREMLVLTMMCQGYTGKEIAAELQISEARVSQIRSSIQEKLMEAKDQWM